MNKKYKIGDEVLVRGIVNSEVRNGGIHVLHDDIDAFYMLDQIHEPQKVVVPKFVADWLKRYQHTNMLLKVLNAAEDERVFPSAVNNWILDNQRDFVVAWFFGYEIEQEKLYTVEIPNPNNTSANVLCLRKDGGKIHISKQNYKTYKRSRYCQLTESEIKQDFEWAWQFREEVE
ncbi:TPA: DUF1642 domain-containing protein [Streptococcus suis]